MNDTYYVLFTDSENHKLNLFGPFDDPADAEAWAIVGLSDRVGDSYDVLECFTPIVCVRDVCPHCSRPQDACDAEQAADAEHQSQGSCELGPDCDGIRCKR